MSLVYKVYLALFILLLGTFVLMGILSADKEILAARDFHNRVIQEIECSNYSESVMRACISNAENQRDYILKIDRILDSNDKMIAAEVVLEYKYSIPILNILTEHKLTGYAR